MGDVYEVRTWFANNDGKRGQTVMHFALATGSGGGEPFGIAGILLTAFQTNIEDYLQACLALDMTITAYTGKRVSSGGGPTAVVLSGAGGLVDGTSLAMMVSANLALIPSFGPYLRKEGHVYVPGIPEAFGGTDIINTTGQSAYNNFGSNLEVALEVGDTEASIVIWDRATATSTPVSNVVLRETMSSIRRRSRPRLG